MITSNLHLPIELEALRDILKKYGVVEASVFGSYARGEAHAESDLDLLVKLEDGRSLFELGGLQYELEDITRRRIDIATRLHPRFEPYITPELVKIL